MAAPIIVACPHGAVTKIATNVVSCDVLIKGSGKVYYQTYVLTGIAAPAVPTNPDDITNVWFKTFDPILNFRPSAASDLYLFCTGGNTSEAGSVRVDV